ncbi:ABC-2 type transport system permease protein [Paenibacillus taihuensis]|uniref:ABC-2 type transport system permease protein n=1 Tax=Paenibacillus taihuensis TaxID=1156355 RepID=A0A3D9SNA9_9BACL|nr:ABC transporter permease subunit [Paenibacillus taihuensis]REE90579.1 ABC-2 type transport system permease protein [Paenibacillus taihuensis]
MLFRREFKRNLRSLIIWSIIIAAIILLYLSIFPEMAKQQHSLDEMMSSMPEGMKKAFGMDRLTMGTALGFYGIEIHLMNTLLGSIFAAMLASNIVAKEQGEKTIEFLLAKPFTRQQIITEKWAAVFTNVLIFNIVIVLASIIGFQFTKGADVSYSTFFLLESAVVLMHLTFASVAFLISTIVKRTRTVVSSSLALVFIMYFFSIIAGVSDTFSFLKYVSPFKYAEAATIITENDFDPQYITIMAVVIVGCVLAGHWYYSRKDITV